jgi:DNA polymerase III delta prime subunit
MKMPPTHPTSPTRWAPACWDDIVGNRQLKKFFRNLASIIREEYRRTGKISKRTLYTLLLTGVSRSGKTSMLKFFVRCLTCQDLDAELNPCRYTCPACRHRPEIEGREGLFTATTTGSGEVPVDLKIIDCGRVNTPSEFGKEISKIELFPDVLQIVFLDEVHRLTRNGADEMLLKLIEDSESLFVLATAHPEGLETMVRNRTVELPTELPGEVEFVTWIVSRCLEFGIACEDEAVIELATRSNRVPGMALRTLAVAATNPQGLTPDVVSDFS